jgi:hypothetical protein
VDVVVGLDSGTTATKAVTAGVDARVRDVVSVGYPLLVPGPGRAELDAGRLQQAAVEAPTPGLPSGPRPCTPTGARPPCTAGPAPRCTRCRRW